MGRHCTHYPLRSYMPKLSKASSIQRNQCVETKSGGEVGEWSLGFPQSLRPGVWAQDLHRTSSVSSASLWEINITLA